MKPAHILFLFLLLGLPFCGLAGPGPGKPAEIRGKVLDQNSGEELTGVRVEIPELGIVTYTDKHGEFVIPAAASSELTFHLSLVSFQNELFLFSEQSGTSDLEFALVEQ